MRPHKIEMSSPSNVRSHNQIKNSCGVDYDDADEGARTKGSLADSSMTQCSVCQAWCHCECFGLSDIEEDDAVEPTLAGGVFRTNNGSPGLVPAVAGSRRVWFSLWLVLIVSGSRYGWFSLCMVLTVYGPRCV